VPASDGATYVLNLYPAAICGDFGNFHLKTILQMESAGAWFFSGGFAQGFGSGVPRNYPLETI
jgi:hypothetical protein